MDDPLDYWKENDVHKTPCSIAAADVEQFVESSFPDNPESEPPRCVLDFCDTGEVISSYRKYIVCYKSHLDWWEWSTTEPPWYDDVRAEHFTDYRRGQAYAAAVNEYGEESVASPTKLSAVSKE
jgi:hypothetical protein